MYLTAMGEKLKNNDRFTSRAVSCGTLNEELLTVLRAIKLISRFKSLAYRTKYFFVLIVEKCKKKMA